MEFQATNFKPEPESRWDSAAVSETPEEVASFSHSAISTPSISAFQIFKISAF